MQRGFPRLYMMLFLKGRITCFTPGRPVADYLHRKVRTRDMGGNSTTHQFTDAVLHKMEQV